MERPSCIETLIGLCEKNPQLEKSTDEGGVLGGYLTRPRLLLHRHMLHMAMGNIKLAIRDLTAALKIDPKFTQARYLRAKLYIVLNLKDRAIAHAEFKRVVRESHPDNYANEVSYAWLAITTLEDANLGTFGDAIRYYEMSIRAAARLTELYGPRTKEGEPPVLEILRARMATLRSTADVERFRRDRDRATPGGFSGPNKLFRHMCLSCKQECSRQRAIKAS